MIKVGVVGGSGRIGVELLRLLIMHPNVRIQVVTSRRYAGERVEDLFPLFRHHFQAEFVEPLVENFTKCDVVFLVGPAGTGFQLAPQLLERKIKVIDFSSDFQLLNATDWKSVHDRAHPMPELLAEAMSGLPETHRQRLRKARLVSMPSAQATLLQLALLPLIEKDWLDPSSLVVNVISGHDASDIATGSRSGLRDTVENIKTLLMSDSIRLDILQAFPEAIRSQINLSMTSVQVPVARGMHATVSVRLRSASSADAQALYDERYADEPFIDVLPPLAQIETRSVQGANMCRMAVQAAQGENAIVIHAVIDNLIKGTAGQAVQAMNLMYGIPEAIGLKHLALMP